MAKIHLDRLKRQYGDIPIKGAVYGEIVKKIIVENTKAVQTKVAKITEDKFNQQAKKYRTTSTRLVLPDLSDVYPKHAVQVKKSADKGKFIRDTLRDELTSKLRTRLQSFSETTGEQNFVSRRGAKAGRVNKQLLEGFAGDIKEVFEGYTKRDPRIGVPTNIDLIAKTEMRSAIQEIKQSYTQGFIDNNPDYEVLKVWIQNRHLANVPRKGHSYVDRISLPFNEQFTVPFYKEIKGKWKLVRKDKMSCPHDPNASLDQVAGCNCDQDIIIRKKRKAEL